MINALPILIPAINPPRTTASRSASAIDDEEEEEALPLDVEEHFTRAGKRKARLSLSTRAQLVLVRKQTRRWHAALAGGLAGALAIMWEKRSRRVFIGQQMFVRLVWSSKFDVPD